MAGAWQFLGPQILAEWIRRNPRPGGHGGAGTRPAAWWVFDARERRQRIDGKPHPFDNPERQAKIAAIVGEYPQRAPSFEYLFYGWIGAYVVPDDHEAVVETEFAYLKRLGLLFDGEEELYAERVRREAERKEREERERLTGASRELLPPMRCQDANRQAPATSCFAIELAPLAGIAIGLGTLPNNYSAWSQS